jgi:light-independent protochlorophyllide reductase subunit B
MLVGASCTAELIQDDPGGLAQALDLPIPVVPLELPAYQRKENFGASETFYRVVRACAGKRAPAATATKPSCNILGPTALGFRHRDDITEITRLLEDLGIGINVVAPWNATPADLARLPDAGFNIVLFPEVALTAATWLERQYGQPFVNIPPIGVGATRDFITAVAGLAKIDPAEFLARQTSRLVWYSRSIDSTYLTGKRVFIFGDATHAIAVARVAAEELGYHVVGLGSYAREFARELREAAKRYGVEPLITDDYLEVEAAIKAANPALVLGTQMERHIAKRLGIPCAVISAPVHVQDFPARYSPVMGFEGANVLFDALTHPLMMGLEEHLLGMFKEDFEFTAAAAPSHLANSNAGPAIAETLIWDEAAERELRKIPFFVRGKARRNTERFAADRKLQLIKLETLYEAKAHYSGEAA